MTRLLIFAAILLATFSCDAPTQQDDSHSVTHGLGMDKAITRSLFENTGTYNGTLPCADCEAIRTKIKLDADRKYIRVQKYLGKTKKNLFEETGEYEWLEDENTIVLKDAEQPNHYKVGDNELTQLDRNGELITGDLAEKYVLRK